MPPLTEEEKEHLDEQFKGYTKHIAKKFKLPMIGLAIAFVSAVTIFAGVAYMQARASVMETHLELTKAKITFYKGMAETGEKMDDMVKDMQFTVDEFNERAAQASLSVGLMGQYEGQMKAAVEHMEVLAKRHQKLKRHKPSNHPKAIKAVEVPKESPVKIPESLTPTPSQPNRLQNFNQQDKGNIFQIPANIQQQIQQRKSG